MNKRVRQCGTTLIELSVVIAVLLLLVGVLFIGITAWKNGANTAACIINLSSIQKAARGYANINQLNPGDALPIANLTSAGFWGTVPVCPAGGSYSDIETVPSQGNAYMTCTISGRTQICGNGWGSYWWRATLLDVRSIPGAALETAVPAPAPSPYLREPSRTSLWQSELGIELSAAGCEKIFQEQVSSVTVRLQLQSALEFVRDGDVFVVTKLDRLARSVADLMAVLQALERKHVAVRILNLGMDTQTPTGKLMLTVLGGVAQFEREMMLERQREGIAKAKSAGKYKGRKPITLERRQHVLRLADEGATKISIARQLGIGEATVYRILAVAKE
jgi:DNA invertase Pin-like site-specific DNA recombinase